MDFKGGSSCRLFLCQFESLACRTLSFCHFVRMRAGLIEKLCQISWRSVLWAETQGVRDLRASLAEVVLVGFFENEIFLALWHNH